MTLRKAEQITCLTITGSLVGDEWSFVATDAAGVDRCRGGGVTESDALEDLVQCNYHRISKEVILGQSNRCSRCGERKPLQAHHKVYRSHGRIDTTDNLEGICQNCHMSIHARGRRK